MRLEISSCSAYTLCNLSSLLKLEYSIFLWQEYLLNVCAYPQRQTGRLKRLSGEPNKALKCLRWLQCQYLRTGLKEVIVLLEVPAGCGFSPGNGNYVVLYCQDGIMHVCTLAGNTSPLA